VEQGAEDGKGNLKPGGKSCMLSFRASRKLDFINSRNADDSE
jgi:hypothetical protein